MSNPDKNPFEYTSDPDLNHQTANDANLTLQAAEAKKKNATKTKVILLVVGILAAFAVLQIGATLFNSPPTSTAQNMMKPVMPVVQNAVPEAPGITLHNSTTDTATQSLSITGVQQDAQTQNDKNNAVSISINGNDKPDNEADVPTPTITKPSEKEIAKETTETTNVVQFAKQEDLSNLMHRLSSLETEVSGLISSFKQIEYRIKKVEESNISAVKPMIKPTINNKVKNTHKPVVKENSRPGFWLDEENEKNDDTTLSSMKTSKLSETKTVEENEENNVNITYHLIAIMQDRAWVKQTDGSMQTVQVGDTLPNGAKVLKIDLKNNEIHTSLGVLR